MFGTPVCKDMCALFNTIFNMGNLAEKGSQGRTRKRARKYPILTLFVRVPGRHPKQGKGVDPGWGKIAIALGLKELSVALAGSHGSLDYTVVLRSSQGSADPPDQQITPWFLDLPRGVQSHQINRFHRGS